MFGFKPLGISEFEELAEHAFARPGAAISTNDTKVITTVSDLDAETFLDVAEIFVELTDEVSEPAIVFRLEYQIAADDDFSQSSQKFQNGNSCTSRYSSLRPEKSPTFKKSMNCHLALTRAASGTGRYRCQQPSTQGIG